MTLKKTIEQHKYTILFCLILVFGSILRLVQLGKVPGGYQMDEAYGAFNAYSLFHSGIDSTGHSYPVYFESWGGGQNALNSYLMLPLLLFTGGRITLLVARLPQAIVAILSLVAVYFLMKEMVDEAAGLWAMLLLSVCPWHIMMSRWGAGVQSGTRVPAFWTDLFCLWPEKTEITYSVGTFLRFEPVLLCDHLAYCSTPSVVGMGIRISYKDFEDQQILRDPCGDHWITGTSVAGVFAGKQRNPPRVLHRPFFGLCNDGFQSE